MTLKAENEQFKAENERLKAENHRLRESNRHIVQRARRSIEEANRISAAAWEAAGDVSLRESSAALSSFRESTLPERSSVASLLSIADGCGAGESLDVRLASADAATPPHSMSLLRQMAENNKKLQEQLAL